MKINVISLLTVRACGPYKGVTARGNEMIKTFETVRNAKTGTTGWVLSRYNRRNDGKAIIEVETGPRRAYWLAAHCEAA